MTKRSKGLRKTLAGAAAAGAVLFTAKAFAGVQNQAVVATKKGDTQLTVTSNKFYCNIAALNPAERARHHQLTEKLKKFRTQIIETEKGYEYRYHPKDVSLAEVAEWVAAESKCCPFFDFHIDLENEGQLVCLRLTGAEGIKEFIRVEFGAANQ